MLLVVGLVLAACGGSDEGSSDVEDGSTGTSQEDGSVSASGNDDEGSAEEPSGDGTRLLVPGVMGGVDIVDLEAESQDTFVEAGQGVYAIQVVGDTLWFVEGNDVVAADVDSGEIRGRASFDDTVADYVVSDELVLVLVGIPGVTADLAMVDVADLSVVGTATAPDGTYYSEPVAAGGSVWAFGGSLELSSTIAQIDASSASQVDVFDTGLIADSVIAAAGSIWVGGTIPSFDGTSAPKTGIAQIDPATGGVVMTIDLGEPSRYLEVHYAFGSLWASTGLDAELFKIDPASGEVVGSVDTGDGAAGIPNYISATEDLIWVFNREAGTMQGYDPDSLEFETGINVPFGAGQPVFAP